MKKSYNIEREAKLVKIGRKKKRGIMITFPFNWDDVSKMHSLPNSKFHRKGIIKYWTCDLSVDAVEKLKNWDFNVDQKLCGFLKDQQIDRSTLEKVSIPELDQYLYPFQREGVAFLEARNGKALIADQMGCIEGNAQISVNRGGKGFKVKLRDAYNRFNGIGKYKWDKTIPTKIRSLKEDHFGLHEARKILYKGERKVLKLTLQSGKELKLTPDHEVLTKNGWCEVQNLENGQEIYVNGQAKCKNCGSTKNVITYKYAKFKGYCKDCMYKYLRHNENQVEHTRRKGSDGYYYLKGSKYHDHPRYTTGGLLEHIYVMEQNIGRYINFDIEEVHHINGIRDDNRIENLKLVNKSEHKKEHRSHLRFVNVIPKTDIVKSIEKNGTTDVYDIVMDDPYRNFVANGIVVHNCGKTIQSLSWLYLHPEKRPAIIVVPASLKFNWEREIKKWLKKPNAQILNGQTVYDITGDIVIINYDILKYWVHELKDLNAKVLITDEAHMYKNNSAQRTKAVKRLAKEIPHVIALTGTPVVSKPIEIFNAVNMVDPTIFPSWWDYIHRYCDARRDRFGLKYDGASNTDELHKKLIDTIMLRRTKEEVLDDLPDKVVSEIPVDISNRDEYNLAERDFIAFIKHTKGEHAARRASNAETLSQISTLKQVAAKGKLQAATNWIENMLSTEGKLVVFAIHTAVIDQLSNKFKDRCVVVDGRVTGNKRQKAIDDFWNNKNKQLFIGNMQAAGTGINLQVASNAAFLELGWTPAEHDQASDRIHRIGQKDSVNIYYLLARNTIDEDIAEAINQKREVVDRVTDGRGADEEKLLNVITGKYKEKYVRHQ